MATSTAGLAFSQRGTFSPSHHPRAAAAPRRPDGPKAQSRGGPPPVASMGHGLARPGARPRRLSLANIVAPENRTMLFVVVGALVGSVAGGFLLGGGGGFAVMAAALVVGMAVGAAGGYVGSQAAGSAAAWTQRMNSSGRTWAERLAAAKTGAHSGLWVGILGAGPIVAGATAVAVGCASGGSVPAILLGLAVGAVAGTALASAGGALLGMMRYSQ